MAHNGKAAKRGAGGPKGQSAGKPWSRKKGGPGSKRK